MTATDPKESLTALESQKADALQALRTQRILALACVALALTISVAALFSNFGAEPPVIFATREAVEAHRKILSDETRSLRDNEEVLRQNREVLANLKKARHSGTP